MSYPPILSVITKESSCGWMVLNFSLFEKLNVGGISILALFGLELVPSVGSQATDITQERQEPVLLRAAKMTLIVPRGGLKEASLWGSEPV